MPRELPPVERSTPAEELDILMERVEVIKARLQSMKLQAQIGDEISPDELRLAVEDISRLDTIMRPRRDVGH